MKRIINWLFFLNNRGEVDGGGPDNEESIGEAIIKSMGATEESPEESSEPKEESKETSEKWDGKNERRKVYEGEKRRASDKVDEDPEYEMDFESEKGNIKEKFKLSELKNTAKWARQNVRSIASLFKMQELIHKYPEYGKMLNEVISRSFVDGTENLNKEFVDKTLSSLEGKAEKIEEKIEGKDDLIEEMQSQIEDLDPDSPQAIILQKSIAYQKNLKNQLQKQLTEGQKRIDALENKLNGVEKKHTDFLSEQDKAEQSVEVKRLSEIYSKEIGALTDKEKKEGYKFIDEDERKEFDVAVRTTVANNSKGINSDESFVKLIQTTAKAVYEKMSKRRESWVNDYLKKKGQPVKKEEETPKKEIKKEEEDLLNGKTIGQLLADKMFADT